MSGISSNEKKSKHKGMLNWNLFLIVVILFEFWSCESEVFEYLFHVS